MTHRSSQSIIIFCIAILSTLFICPTGADAKINFKKGSLSSVKKDAAKSGKLYYVYFTASWCAPCNIMKKYTFTDPGLGYYSNKNYIALEADWDSFDAFDLRKQYNITSLPAILVFTSKGYMVGKYEMSFSASKMLEMLKRHNTSGNRGKPTSVSRPPLKPKTKSSNTGRDFSKGSSQVSSGSGLFMFDVKPRASTGYSVQIGVYAQYGNVLREVSKFKKLFNEPILVHIDQLRNKTVYRVMVGEFSSLSAANRFTRKVKNKGLDGFAKDLSGLK